MDKQISLEEQIIRNIAIIRKLGRVNMCDRKGVIQELEIHGCSSSASYLKNISMGEYIKLLEQSGNF